MNLDKVIKDLEGMKKAGFASCSIQGFLNQLEKVTESVVVDKFVADWYEEHKGDLEYNIWDWIAFRDEPKKSKNKKFNDWLNKGVHNPIQTLVKMHLFGYEVNKDKKYTVRVVETEQILYKSKAGYKFINNYYEKSKHKYEFTEHDLKFYNMSYVFNNKAFKVEEVE